VEIKDKMREEYEGKLDIINKKRGWN
jgi:hypothetical protein